MEEDFKPDFGTMIYTAFGDRAFAIEVFKSTNAIVYAYDDFFSVTFIPIASSLAKAEGGMIPNIPISKYGTPHCLTIEVPCKNPTDYQCDRWVHEYIGTGKKLILRAAKDREYTTSRTGEVVLPCVPIDGVYNAKNRKGGKGFASSKNTITG